MPRRKIPFVTGNYYHVFNRGVAKNNIFESEKDYLRAIKLADYYKHETPKMCFSRLLLFSALDQKKIIAENKALPKIVSLLAYCLMPNHFHFLLKQKKENGIQTFLRIFQNSYVKYFNTVHERVGPLFQGTFRAVPIKNQETLLHVSRYIHLNPYSSGIVSKPSDIFTYNWSSASEYKENKELLCNTKELRGIFSSKEDFTSFILDQAEYQKSLERIKSDIIR